MRRQSGGGGQGWLRVTGRAGECRAQSSSLSTLSKARERRRPAPHTLGPPSRLQGPAHTTCSRVLDRCPHALPSPMTPLRQGPAPFSVPRGIVGAPRSKLAPAHGMELDLQGAEVVEPQGRCRLSGNTRALASPHGPRAWQPGHAIRGEGEIGAALQTHSHPTAPPPPGAGPPTPPGCAQHPPLVCRPLPGRPGPAPSHSMPGRPVGPIARGTRVGPPHSCKASLPPHPRLPTRAENTSSGSDFEPRWPGPKRR